MSEDEQQQLSPHDKLIIEEAVSRVLEDVSPAVLRLETLVTQMQRRLADLTQRVKELEDNFFHKKTYDS